MSPDPEPFMKVILTLNHTAKRWIALGVSLFMLFSLFLISFAVRPIDDQAAQATVYIPRGTSFLAIVNILDQAGMVKHRALFILLARLKGAAGSIKPGEYELATSMSPWEITDKLTKGKIKIRRVIIPEDFTLKQIAGLLVAEELVSEESFLSVTTEPVFLTSLNIDADSAEGYLYPDTYHLYRGMTPQEIVRGMVSRFRDKVTPQMLERAKALGMTTTEFVTLASLIGKETGYTEEKAKVSAVFHNRLKKGMRLQSDPTAVYSLTEYRHIVRRKHLDNDTPYNTYKIRGLPPGPIANPGIDSLQAALNPAHVNYLYFVSNNDGTHKFSSNLAEHTQAVLKYQNKRKKE
ncbi:MAG: endolytic transglycosylase MltG [Syntrophus sp. (in: bacteria)]|nr:endolytic transglycosylase MltG [Syntrophus sp. (in: bacteria)]